MHPVIDQEHTSAVIVYLLLLLVAMIRLMSTQTLPPAVAMEILRTSTEAMVITDADGQIVFVNRAAEILFGYGASEMLGEPVEILLPQEQREQHHVSRNAYLASPRSRPVSSGLELYGSRKDGTRFRSEISLTPVETSDGLLVISSIREISASDESEAYFRTLLESAPDAMIIVDEAGRIAIVNGQAESMFGYDRGEMLGHSVEFLLPQRLRKHHVLHRQGFGVSAKIRPMGVGLELIGLRKDSSEFPVEISLSPVSTAAGAFVCSVIRDVSRRKHMEQEIVAAQEAAERANKANSAFLAAASHDLRQPVQALSLLNGALRRTVKDERALEMIEHQETSLTAMTNLLNSLLDISRLDAGVVSPDFESFPMQRLIDRLSPEFSRQALHKGLDFISRSGDVMVRSDPNLLSEIIQNLVSNAIRYTEKGSVSLICGERDGRCSIDVKDTGIGIESDQLDSIFREFYQCRSPGVNKEGFGLGLAIVRRLADLLEHDITVKSGSGKGSCFSVSMPVIACESNAAVVEDSDSTEEQGSVSGLIILIEDDASVANAWGLLLEVEGYQVVMAESATEARTLVNHLDVKPSLLISDFHLLDGSTGVEAVTEIRGYYDTIIPAFIVSGDTSKVVKDARSLENTTLMSKPVSTQRLLAAARIATRTGKVPQD